MSADLVKRARNYARNLGGPPEDYLTWQLADEIERVRVLHDHLVLYGQEQAAEIERLRAREAELMRALRRLTDEASKLDDVIETPDSFSNAIDIARAALAKVENKT